MEKKMAKRIACFIVAVMMVTVVSAKNSKKSNKKSTFDSIPIIKGENGRPVDLGGMEIIIADWWSPETPAAPGNAKDEADFAYRNWIQKTYNFRIRTLGIDSWNEHPGTFNNYVAGGGDKNNYVFLMGQDMVSTQMKKGMLYDLATLKNFDFSQKKWQPLVTKLMTRGNHIYGMSANMPEPRHGIFFNKRILKDAGIDPDSLYDMQEQGTWTWDAYEAICKKVTRDINNDGVIDVYGMTNTSGDFLKCAAFSNNAYWVGLDKNGKYYNATGTDEFLEAMTWGCKMAEKYELPVPDGSPWDFAYAAFRNGKAAMQAYCVYAAGSMKDMKDDYGFVCFPKGPRATGYTNVWWDNVYVIPSCYDAGRAEKIAFAYNLYTEPTPGYDNSTAWKNQYYGNFRDARAVDETIAMMETNGTIWYDQFVPGLNTGDIIWHIWNAEMTPAEAIENAKGLWQGYIDEANK